MRSSEWLTAFCLLLGRLTKILDNQLVRLSPFGWLVVFGQDSRRGQSWTVGKTTMATPNS